MGLLLDPNQQPEDVVQKTFFNLNRNHGWLARHDERAFLKLLFAVLRELANPAPPADFVTRIKLHHFTNRSTNSERRTTMKPITRTDVAPLNRNQMMFTPLDRSTGRGMSRSSLGVAVVFNLIAITVISLGIRNHIVVRKPSIDHVFFTPTKIDQPLQPKFLAKVDMPKPDIKPLESSRLPRTETPVPDPPAPAPVARTTAPAMKMPDQPKVVATAPTPTVIKVNMTTNPTPIQPTGPTVVTTPLKPSSPAASATGPIAMKNPLGTPAGRIGDTQIAGAKDPRLGCPGCNGNRSDGTGTGPTVAKVDPIQPRKPYVEPPFHAQPAAAQATVPQVISKPKPVYTQEAIAQHVEGTIMVRIHVSADGTVKVLGLSNGLGYGLDQSALKCAQGIHFNPAKDASGAAIDWEGTVGITFQIS